MVNLDTDDEEPEVLDLENPSFDIRSADELPAQEAQTDIVDRLEFEQDTLSSNPPSSRSQCALLRMMLIRVPVYRNCSLQISCENKWLHKGLVCACAHSNTIHLFLAAIAMSLQWRASSLCVRAAGCQRLLRCHQSAQLCPTRSSRPLCSLPHTAPRTPWPHSNPRLRCLRSLLQQYHCRCVHCPLLKSILFSCSCALVPSSVFD